jgi:hypothetical protein
MKGLKLRTQVACCSAETVRIASELAEPLEAAAVLAAVVVAATLLEAVVLVLTAVAVVVLLVLATVPAGVVVAVAESPQAANNSVRKVTTNTSHCDFKRINFIK